MRIASPERDYQSALKNKCKLLESFLYVVFAALGELQMHYSSSCVKLLKGKYQEEESIQVSGSLTFYS